MKPWSKKDISLIYERGVNMKHRSRINFQVKIKSTSKIRIKKGR